MQIKHVTHVKTLLGLLDKEGRALALVPVEGHKTEMARKTALAAARIVFRTPHVGVCVVVSIPWPEGPLKASLGRLQVAAKAGAGVPAPDYLTARAVGVRELAAQLHGLATHG